VLVRSGGIEIVDDQDCSDPITCCNTTFSGPYVRWQTVRRNTISGVAAIDNECGQIALHGSAGEVRGSSSDVVVESNTVTCPNASLWPAGATHGVDVNCSHCAVRIWASCDAALDSMCGGGNRKDPVLCGVCIEKHALSLHDGGGCSMSEAEAWCRGTAAAVPQL
jgi:hypothetical protein